MTHFRALLLAFALLLLIPLPRPKPAEGADATDVRIIAIDGSVVTDFSAFGDIKGTTGSVTAADLGGDGVSEIVFGAGRGTKPLVRVYRQDGSKIFEFTAYAESFTGGVNVAVCDLDGDGQGEIVTGAGFGGGPHIRMFSNTGTPLSNSFFAFDPVFRGGVTVACGDIDNDGQVEIITGQGLGGKNVVKAFTPDGVLKYESTLPNGSDVSGANVSVGEATGDNVPDIIAAPLSYGDFPVTILRSSDAGLVQSTVETPSASTYGSSFTAFKGNVYFANGAYLPTNVTKLGSTVSFTPFDEGKGYGTLLSSINEKDQLIAVSSPSSLPRDVAGQYIKVDISEQKLTAYQNGIEVKSFLVSTAKPGFKTPIGQTTIMAKIPVMDYTWSYGAGNPNNYSIPNVKWNMRIFPHIYIHSAYWHNNFGHPMSHGCVNTSVEDAEWIYNWAEVGTAVETVP